MASDAFSQNKGLLAANFTVVEADLGLRDFPEEIQGDISENLATALHFLSRNDSMIAAAYDKLAAYAEAQGRPDLRDLILQSKDAFEKQEQTRFGHISDWRGGVFAMEQYLDLQGQAITRLFDILRQSGIDPKGAGIDPVAIIGAVYDNQEKVKEALDAAKHPEFPELQTGAVIVIPDELKQEIITRLQVRVSSAIFDSYSQSLEGMEQTLATIEQIAGMPENADPELSQKIDSLKENWDALFEIYGRLKAFAEDPSQDPNAIEENNRMLEAFLRSHTDLLDQLDKLIDEYPQLSLYPHLRETIEEIRENVESLLDEAETNEKFLGVLVNTDRAALDPADTSPTDPDMPGTKLT